MSVVQPALAQRDWERVFFTGTALVMAAVVFTGFARTFFLRPWFPEIPAPPEPIFLTHGLVFSAWMVLLVIQTALIATGRRAVHQSLGLFGALLAVAVVTFGVSGALVAAERPGGFMNVPVPPLQFLIVPLLDMTIFGTCVALAVIWRKHPQSHKRLMLLATISMLTAAFARFPLEAMFNNVIVAFILTDLFIVALAVWDVRSRGRLHPVTAWAGGFTIVSQPLRLALSESAAWVAFAGWLVA
jgi:uncharacterized membrane protein YozB (DUF420 family)